MKTALKTVCFTLLLVFLTASVGIAAPPAPKQAQKGKKVLRFDQLTITGEAKSPQVYYLLNRKRILLKHQPAEYDFVPSIKHSVRERPF